MALHIIRVLFFMLPAVAWAQPAVAPPPPSKSDIDKAEAFIKSDPAMVAMATRQLAAALAGQATVQQPTAPAPPAVAPVPAAPLPPSVGFSPPPELMAAIWALVGTIVITATGAVAAWGKSHSETVKNNKIMQQVGINQDIDNAQKTQGGLVELELANQGRSLIGVNASDPIVQVHAQTLRGRYPEWGPMTGLTQDIAAQKVLGSAVNQSVTPLVPTAAVAVVPPQPALAVVEAAATPQQPAQGTIT